MIITLMMVVMKGGDEKFQAGCKIITFQRETKITFFSVLFVDTFVESYPMTAGLATTEKIDFQFRGNVTQHFAMRRIVFSNWRKYFPIFTNYRALFTT